MSVDVLDADPTSDDDGFSDGFSSVGGDDSIDSTILGMPDDKDDDDDDVVNVDFFGDVNGTRRFV